MITQNYITVSPAYGRDYKTQKEARDAFLSGVDFEHHSMFHSGTYCSVRDFAPGVVVNVRYKKMTMVIPVKVSHEQSPIS